ncbi:MAG TPA: hypothetical protein VEJ87_06970, partial [Acidimicrobiales bacterium]|nr:hypothetical protein [Acidimicrobiales bacterium]
LEVDKGTVVENLAETCRAACFVGDDVGDLAAFAALDRLEAKGTRAVRVAVADEESPPELRARADLVVADPQSVKRLFQALVSAAAEKT